MGKANVLKIRLIPTDESLWIYLGNPEDVVKEFNKDDFEVDSYGCFFRDKNKKGRMTYVIYLSIRDLQLLVHELTHAVDYFSDDMEIKSKELRAYYMDYLFQLVYKKFDIGGKDVKK